MSKEIEDLCKAVDEFSQAMKDRLVAKYNAGFTGWRGDDTENKELLAVRDKDLRIDLCEKVSNILWKPRSCMLKHLVDIANYAMMFWYRRTRK